MERGRESCCTRLKGDQRTYVVEETDPSVDFDSLLDSGCVVERDGALNVGLVRLACHGGSSDSFRVVGSHG